MATRCVHRWRGLACLTRPGRGRRREAELTADVASEELYSDEVQHRRAEERQETGHHDSDRLPPHLSGTPSEEPIGAPGDDCHERTADRE